MKNIVIGLLLGVVLAFGTAAAFKGFGPIQTKALIKVLIDELNRNRDWHGKPHITAEQVRDALEDETAVITTNLANDVDLSWLARE